LNLEKFRPALYLSSAYKVDYEALWREGIRGILFDIDNTLFPYYVPHATNEAKALIDKLKKMGFKVGILSNGRSERVQLLKQEFGMEGVSRAAKPLRFGAFRMKKTLGLPASQIALIGDQIFMDVLCANRMGFKSILTVPIDPVNDEKSVMKRRGAERKIISRLNLYPEDLQEAGNSDEDKAIPRKAD